MEDDNIITTYIIITSEYDYNGDKSAPTEADFLKDWNTRDERHGNYCQFDTYEETIEFYNRWNPEPAYQWGDKIYYYAIELYRADYVKTEDGTRGELLGCGDTLKIKVSERMQTEEEADRSIPYF